MANGPPVVANRGEVVAKEGRVVAKSHSNSPDVTQVTYSTAIPIYLCCVKTEKHFMNTATIPVDEKVLTFLAPEALQLTLTSIDEWTVHTCEHIDELLRERGFDLSKNQASGLT